MPSWLRDPRRHRAVFALALPMVFSNVTTPLLGLVDTWVIGHLGQAWFLGGVSVGATLINLLFWLLGFLRMSTTGLTAQAQGAASAEGQLDTLARALGLAVGLGLALLALVASGLMRRPYVITLGWIVQALTWASAVVVTAMIGVALVFTALWLLLLVQGMKVDRIVSEREQSDAGEPAPDAA